jgi:adenine-specific DNA-methyltransferase
MAVENYKDVIPFTHAEGVMTSQLSLIPADRLLVDIRDEQTNHGEVFTRRWVVEFILDLIGYKPTEDLGARVLVEPACGAGAFLLPIIDRLFESCALHGRVPTSIKGAIRAFDVLEENAILARRAVARRLREHGVSDDAADELADRWVTTADFLLYDHEPGSADFVVGNPPYVRLEDVPRQLTAAYRRAWPTMQGRSDIYVGFFEAGLRLLAPDGAVGFICADRWMHNQYGGPLRELITSEYAIDTIVSMHDVDAFEEEVSAYPAVFILRSGEQRGVQVVETDASFNSAEAREVRDWTQGRISTTRGTTYTGTRLETWFKGRASWPDGGPERQALVADLESRFPPLEDPSTGTRVSIGVATGRDEVYITTDEGLVESDRLLPLLLAQDTKTGVVDWSGHYLVNPWNDHGLVDLADYPRLHGYLVDNAEKLKARHVAKRRPQSWYRTIDRVDPELLRREKLVLPDIKAEANPVLETGQLYPHHNLYFVVSDGWDLEVLGGLLLSDVANAVIGSYCVKMRGGYYRFQAQYLRRLRAPSPSDIDPGLRRDLALAFQQRDRRAATELAVRVYGLDPPTLREASVT